MRVSRSLESNIWQQASAVFTPVQQQELRAAIQGWWETNPNEQSGFFTRPQEFSALVRQTRPATARSDSVFNLVGLDPMAGLDPAVREVTSTRLFAERAMFMAQRMPFLLRWQTELMTDELLQQEQVANALNSADRLSRAAESASQTAAQLPDRIATERQAVLDALQAQEGKLRELSAELARTLAAGEKMSDSLNTTLVTFDALMKRFGVGEPSTSPPDTNSPPFNILDYAHTAGQVAAMAQQLDVVIKDLGSTLDSPALDRRLTQVEALSERARSDAQSVLNHAFLLAAGLVALVFAGVWVVRRTAARVSGATRS